MADQVKARWHGDNYQARIFWQNALNLLDPTSGVFEVSFEADGPKSFDDVVVKYDPPIPRSGAQRVPAEYHQVKWHVASGGRFGYEDFIDPAFIGAQSFSLLQRLQQAARPPGRRAFPFMTTTASKTAIRLVIWFRAMTRRYSVSVSLTAPLIGAAWGRCGSVGETIWAWHRMRNSGDVVGGLRVFEGHRSLEELRTEINLRARVVGLLTCETSSDFRYDKLARQLKFAESTT